MVRMIKCTKQFLQFGTTYVLPMTKLMLAAIAALNRHAAVPGSVPNRYPDDAVRIGTAGMARISAKI